MLVPHVIRKCVAHLYEDDPVHPGERRPLGTACGVGVPLEGCPDRWACYLVTARHVVNGARGSSGTLYVRFNKRAGGFVDVPVMPDSWKCHDSTDVAVAGLGLGADEIDFMPITIDIFAPDDFIKTNRVGEGDDVFFVGLFSKVPGNTQNQPVMRFGKIALGRHEPIAIRSDPGPNSATILVDAYLVETHSWGGSSGAPAFLYFEPTRRQWAKTEADAPLLGLVHGHYELDAHVKYAGDIRHEEEAEARVGVNSGIAVVIPASDIVTLLNSEELTEERKRIASSFTMPSPPPS